MRQYRSLRMFKGKISFLIDSRAVMITLVLIGVAAALLIASTGLGDMKMNPLAVISVFFGGGTDLERLVVLDFRLPRIIVALLDRKSTRLNSSHVAISYAVFCLKKKS